jgi:hypothetical protein
MSLHETRTNFTLDGKRIEAVDLVYDLVPGSGQSFGGYTVFVEAQPARTESAPTEDDAEIMLLPGAEPVVENLEGVAMRATVQEERTA